MAEKDTKSNPIPLSRAAKELGISRITLRRMVIYGKIPATDTNIPGRKYRCYLIDVDKAREIIRNGYM